VPSLSASSTLPDDLTSFISQPPEPVEETIPNEEQLIEEEVKEEPENKIVVYGTQRAGNSSTATEQTLKKNDIDNSIPAFLRPINAPLPSTNIKDIIGLRPTVSETKDIRQARINKLDKKPLLAIEPQSTQDEANDTIKLLENILKPPTPTKPPPPPPQAAAEDEPDTDTSHLDESPELRAFKDSFKNKYRWNWQMGQLLIDNGIKDPKTGNNFYVNPSNKVLVRGSRTALDKEALKDNLLKAFNDGLIKKF
jgi:hypothetical protein